MNLLMNWSGRDYSPYNCVTKRIKIQANRFLQINRKFMGNYYEYDNCPERIPKKVCI